MFDVGLLELAVIALVAVLVLGPERVPELTRQAVSMLRSVRRFARAARDELRDELGPEYADLELRDLDPRTIVRRHLQEALAEDDDEPGPGGARGVREPGHRPLAEGERPPYDVDAT